MSISVQRLMEPARISQLFRVWPDNLLFGLHDQSLQRSKSRNRQLGARQEHGR